MKANLQRRMLPVVAGCAISLAARNAFGLGGDYPNSHVVSEPSWPAGMKGLANGTNRIGGFFVNADDVFYFSGTPADFSAFLKIYSEVAPIRQHLLILHRGIGEARSLRGENRRPCDWSLEGCPGHWHDLRTGITNKVLDTNYVLEVHFWTGGNIALDQVAVPNGVDFAGDYLKVFDSLTNGMTRAEVEKHFRLDGGLQGQSPVRVLHPSCPMFKVNVEFDFKRDASDQNRAVTGRADKVIRVSKPYLERPFMD